MLPFPDNYVANAYGDTVQSFLRPFQTDFASLAKRIADLFHGYIVTRGRAAEVIHRLRPARLEWLQQQLENYLIMLSSDELTRAAHQEASSKVGMTHALIGVDIRWVVETYAFYEAELHKLLDERVSDTATQQAITRVIAQRLLMDIEGQASSSKQIAREVTLAFSRLEQAVMSTETMTDLIRDALEIIGSLPGGVPVFFARVDNLGKLQIEQSYSDAAEAYHQAMEDGDMPKISTDPNLPAGNGPGGRAWRSGAITVSDSWLIDSDKKPWLKVGEKLGFRSSAAVPLLDDSGHAIALLSLYSPWPGYFSTENIRGFLNHLQQTLSHAVQRRINAPVVPLREQQLYRALLTEKNVVMHYQPVIDLRDGSLVKIEALARMRSCDGRLIPPLRFLPALGQDELLELFKQGLAHVCSDFSTLKSQGIETQVAINLPAEGLDDPRYEKTIFSCLEGQCALSNRHLQIEILENQETGERSLLHYEFVKRLKESGVQITQDDLGSGHSSLLRLDQYPFDEVKIDQGLVRGALHNPKRALEFILYLTRLGHAFNKRVTVEGLENEGMIEAAAILGADYGQGYGISKPMPIEQFANWHESYQYTINPTAPKTALGALAGYLLWDIQLATLSEQPELASEFVGSKVIVEQFIKVNNLQDGPIDRLLSLSLELIVSKSGRSKEVGTIRSELIKELTEHWIREIKE